MEFAAPVVRSLASRLQRLYGEQGDRLLPELLEMMSAAGIARTGGPATSWSQRDVVLITYGDQIRAASSPPLAVLREFILDRDLDQLINTVHLLPFCPSSSDDGFSVIDYLQVDPQLGSWDDIASLGQHCQLMFDLVLNHISQSSAWFQDYLRGVAPYDTFFIEVDPATDVSAVTRPRSLPLLTPCETSRGLRHVWTTFSPDQIDLNYANPQVLLRMVEVLLAYVARGARIVRLDAIAYLWKRLGTSCIHLSETHEVVKLFRDVLSAVAPDVLLLTETNVPHQENISYFGDGDEAQMVYQFSLPPLLLDAFLNADGTTLSQWLRELQPPSAGTTFFNFTASHDGIGVRPLEGLVPAQRIETLVRFVKSRGGLVNTRRQADGSDSPYELNITYVDALGTTNNDPAMHARRFLASQAVMLALQGVPGVYFHSLVGTQNDLSGVERTGHARSINRRKFERDELEASLTKTGTLQQQVFAGYQRLLRQRIAQPAFHPDAAQQTLSLTERRVLALLRTCEEQQIVVLVNFSDAPVEVDWAALPEGRHFRDLLGQARPDRTLPLVLDPYQAMWLVRA